MTRLVKSTGSVCPLSSMSWMRLCAASRPVSSLPESSSAGRVSRRDVFLASANSRFTRVELASGVQVTFGQSVSDGASNSAGPEPSSTKCAWRVAAQFGIIATGWFAACAG